VGQRVIAIVTTPWPTWTGRPAWFVAIVIGVTVPAAWQDT
jgi:hypothetical protein